MAIWGGYTLLNFFAVYMVGVAIKKEIIDLKHPGLMLCVSAVLLYAWRYIYTGVLTQVAFSYDNPLIIMMALSWFSLFEKMEIRGSKVINLLGKASLAVYLLHHFVIGLFGLEWAKNASLPVYILYQLIVIAVSYVSAIVGTYVFDYIWKIVLKIKPVKRFMNYEIKA